MDGIDPRIFRAYDIRGVAHEQLTEDACRAIGRAFGSILRERTGKDSPTVCVGRDARTHGPALEEAVTNGLASAGCTVLLIGQTPSPVNYFTVCDRGLDGGVQVTASHNPAPDNGLKLCTANAEAFADDDIQYLKRTIERGDFLTGKGSVEAIDAIAPYERRLREMFAGVGDGMRIATDTGNGVAGPVYCNVLGAIGADVTKLYAQPDGTFPHHDADPSKHSTLRELQATVTGEKLDIGLAFDGDGDRLGIVDEHGVIRSADEILLTLAVDHLQRFPGAPIVFTVSNSGVLQTEIDALGGKPVMCKVGHSFVEHAMHECGSLLGGEQSGHFFCGEEYFPFDDALVAALRVLSIMQKTGKTFSQLCADFPRTYQAPERRPHVPDERKGAVIESIILHWQKNRDVLTLDGARIDFGDGAWAGIRQSNTSPRISICIEARTPEKLAEVERLVLDHLKTYPEIGGED